MPRHSAVTTPHLDAKTRRKLEDQRRMAFRRAIEHYNEERRLNQSIDDYPELIAINYVRSLRSEARRQPGA
ncbi:MAG TPA: transcriptional regulator, partial [Pseudomonas sp.]|nr:transcriptional regulator [Pseudomonas sp.]